MDMTVAIEHEAHELALQNLKRAHEYAQVIQWEWMEVEVEPAVHCFREHVPHDKVFATVHVYVHWGVSERVPRLAQGSEAPHQSAKLRQQSRVHVGLSQPSDDL